MQDQSFKSGAKRTAVVAAIFFVAALIVRLVYLHQFSQSPFFDPEIVGFDAGRFDKAAQAIASGEWLGEGVFQYMPGYGYLLGIIYAIFGRNLTAAYIVQCLLGAGSVALLYVLAKRIASNKVAWIAAIGGVFSQMLVFHVGILTGEMLAVFLMLACLLALSVGIERQSFKYFLLAGMLAGLGVLCRGTFALFVLLFIPWHAIVERRSFLKRVLPNIIALLLGTALMVAPATIKNYVLGDDFVLVTAHGGVTHYLGYNAEATGAYRPEKLLGPNFIEMYVNARKIAEEKLGRSLKSSEVSAFWRHKAIGYVRSNPGHALRLAGEKVFLFFHNVEFTDVIHIKPMKKFSWLLGYCLIPFGLIAPFALLGMGVAIRRKCFGPMYLFVLATLLSVVLVHMNARYRLTAVPLFLAFAGVALVWFKDNYRSMGRMIVGIVVVSICFYVVYRPIDTRTDPSLHAFEIGKTYYRAGKDALAAKEFRRAIRMNPGLIGARLLLGHYLQELRRFDEAEDQFNAILEIDPNQIKALNEMGIISYHRGDKKKALEYWQRSFEVDSSQPELRSIIERTKLSVPNLNDQKNSHSPAHEQ